MGANQILSYCIPNHGHDNDDKRADNRAGYNVMLCLSLIKDTFDLYIIVYNLNSTMP